MLQLKDLYIKNDELNKKIVNIEIDNNFKTEKANRLEKRYNDLEVYFF